MLISIDRIPFTDFIKAVTNDFNRKFVIGLDVANRSIIQEKIEVYFQDNYFS
ncbi:MAG: hypothetical protein AB7V56_16410 [Candidatus Nitrosocosmicus sp.]